MVKKAQIQLVIRLKAAITLGLTLLLLLIWGQGAAISSFIGGLIASCGALLYVVVAYSADWDTPERLMRRHFAAEAAKLLFTLAAFAAVFIIYRQVAWPWVFAGYLAAASAYWFGILIHKR